jgi:1,2-dihydroxy-3-keto-5-methylthiopentene dioxygenase
MARLEYQGHTYFDTTAVTTLLAEHGVPYERWGLRATGGATDEQIIGLYQDEIQRLKRQRRYLSEDLIALRPTTPNLAAISAKFDKEHHHVDDEVRFTVEGEGVFEIASDESCAKDMLKFTAEPGDLIVIPAYRRHLFYLTEKKTIRCIRLFKTKEGWEALYEKPTRELTKLHVE